MSNRYSKRAVPIPDIDDLELITPDESVQALVTRRQNCIDEVKRLKLVIDKCDEALAVVLDLNRLKAVSYESWVISRREATKPQRSIDPMKLLALGVSAEVIEASTDVGEPGKAGVTVRQRSRRDEED